MPLQRERRREDGWRTARTSMENQFCAIRTGDRQERRGATETRTGRAESAATAQPAIGIRKGLPPEGKFHDPANNEWMPRSPQNRSGVCNLCGKTFFAGSARTTGKCISFPSIYLIECSLITNSTLRYHPNPAPQRPEKIVDPKDDWVYIHECHPFKGELRRAILQTHLVISRIKLSWGSSVDAPVCFQESTGMGMPGAWLPGTALCITDLAQKVFLAREGASRFLNWTPTSHV